MNAACKADVLNQQLAPRISSLHGFFELVASIVQGYFAGTALFVLGIYVMRDATTCSNFAIGYAEVIKNAFNYEAPMRVYFTAVLTSAQDQIAN